MQDTICKKTKIVLTMVARPIDTAEVAVLIGRATMVLTEEEPVEYKSHPWQCVKRQGGSSVSLSQEYMM